jgi:hypothetical protein
MMSPLLFYARRRNRGARGRCPCPAELARGLGRRQGHSNRSSTSGMHDLEDGFEELGKGIAESGALSFARPEGRAPSFYFRTRVWTISPVRLAAQARPFTGKGIVIHFTTARPTPQSGGLFSRQRV